MAPNLGVTTITTLEEPMEDVQETPKYVIKGYKGIFGEYMTEIKWLHVIPMGLFHLVCLYQLLTFPFIEHFGCVLWGAAMCFIAGFGVTAGAHRYWCHRSYKAKLPLQVLLMICFNSAGQNNIYDWVRDHRVHHKYSETHADPHNANRGFFFSHIGWLFLKKHPEVIRRGKELDMSDISEDAVVKFHLKYFHVLRVVLAFIVPSLVPIYFWGEHPYYAFVSQICGRFLFTLHATWSVNSVAHLYGNKPYDVTIFPRQNKIVSFIALGEGWHNFHHTFPWDYRAAEFAKLNFTMFALNWFAKMGWAYDMKKASDNLIKMVIERRGPDAHHNHHHDEVPEPVPEPITCSSSEHIKST